MFIARTPTGTHGSRQPCLGLGGRERLPHTPGTMQEAEPEPWVPVGVLAMNMPKPKPEVDLRWRPGRRAESLPREPTERTRRVVNEQCMNARTPGYTGFIPSQKAEDLYGMSGRKLGRTAGSEQSRRAAQRSEASLLLETAYETHQQAASANATMRSLEGAGAPAMPNEHPLGWSRAEMGRGHWVPTIPGYSGYIPGKFAENIVGGGVIDTCRMAGQAIAKRDAPLDPRPMATMEGSHVKEYYHARNAGEGLNLNPAPAHMQLAADLRDHCSKQIPGYMGHVPRIHGESIYGGTRRAANLIAAEMCEDRVFNPLT